MEEWRVKTWASAPGANPERVLVHDVVQVRSGGSDLRTTLSAALTRVGRTYEPPFRIVSLVRVDPPADQVS